VVATDSQTLSNKTLASPTLTGVPTAPTAAMGTNTTQVATTAFVQSAIVVPGAWMTTMTAGNNGAVVPSAANKMMLWGVVLPYAITTTKVTYSVGVADNSANTYDLGVYDSTGTLRVHVGSTAGTTFAPSTGAKTLNWVASATLQPGKYYIAFTSSCSASCTASLSSPSANGFVFYKAEASTPISITTGGSLPGSFTPPADNPSWAAYTPALFIN